MPPLKECLSQKIIENYPRQVYLLTDGAVFNTSSVIAYVTQHTKKSRVHTIGIGNGCSEDLIIGCAEMGKGYKTFITDEEDLGDKIIELLDRSLSPVIKKIDITGDKNNIESIVPNPDKCPYILRNEVANFYFTFKGKLKEPVKLNLNYTDSMNNNYSGTVEILPKTTNCSFINKMVDFVELSALCAAYKY